MQHQTPSSAHEMNILPGELIRTATGYYLVAKVQSGDPHQPGGFVMARRAERPQTRHHVFRQDQVLEIIKR